MVDAAVLSQISKVTKAYNTFDVFISGGTSDTGTLTSVDLSGFTGSLISSYITVDGFIYTGSAAVTIYNNGKELTPTASPNLTSFFVKESDNYGKTNINVKDNICFGGGSIGLKSVNFIENFDTGSPMGNSLTQSTTGDGSTGTWSNTQYFSAGSSYKTVVVQGGTGNGPIVYKKVNGSIFNEVSVWLKPTLYHADQDKSYCYLGMGISSTSPELCIAGNLGKASSGTFYGNNGLSSLTGFGGSLCIGSWYQFKINYTPGTNTANFYVYNSGTTPSLYASGENISVYPIYPSRVTFGNIAFSNGDAGSSVCYFDNLVVSGGGCTDPTINNFSMLFTAVGTYPTNIFNGGVLKITNKY